MKKLLLLGAALLVSAGVMAQSTGASKFSGTSNKYEKVQKFNRTGSDQQVTTPTQKPAQTLNNKATQTILKTTIGTSQNVFSVLLPDQTGLTSNEETGLIMMTHRAVTVSGVSSSGDIRCGFSTDGGFSFNDTTVIPWKTSFMSNAGRYPSGVIYNPTGNTTPANAYAVAAGPILDAAATNFIGGFFASETFAGTNGDYVETLYATDTVGAGDPNQFPRMFMQNRGTKFFLYGDANTDDGTNYTSIKTVLNLGTWNAGTNSVDWVRSSHTPDYLSDGLGNPEGYASPGYLMEDDGLNGYLIYIGRDADAIDQLTFQPMIYTTTDGGLNWTKAAAFDWTDCPEIVSLATQGNVNRPMFGSVKDAVIDADGYLHFSSYIYLAATDNVDSLGYYSQWTGMQGIVFDTYQTATGWNTMVVDSVFAIDPTWETTLIDNGDQTNGVGWDERFQMSRTADGSKIIYAWMDTDASLSENNLYPNIFVRMYDVATATMGPKVNITGGTDYDGMNYWMYLSDITFDMGSYYQLHISTSTLNMDSNGPVDHEYITGAYLDETGNLVSSVSELPLEASIALYPNPTSGDLNISFNDIAAGNYNVVVFNTIGSVVLSQNIDVNGAVVRTINMNELPTGIYMVQVSNENGSTTKKVIKN